MVWNLLNDLHQRLFGAAKEASQPKHVPQAEFDKGAKHYRYEALESREMLNADPLLVGGVYIEDDPGSDLTGGDTFEVSFTGGAPGSQLVRFVIDGDHDGLPTLGTNDMFFDTVKQSSPNLTDAAGKGAASPFVEVGRVGDFTYTVSVQDGSTQLVLTFQNFDAGDKLLFKIDVDEVNNAAFGPLNGVDEIASGLEFHGSKMHAEFIAPHYQDVSIDATYTNEFSFVGTGLSLSPDNAGATVDNPDGKANRTAGGYGQITQQPLPIAISGTVYHDRDLDLTQDSTDSPLAGVSLSLWKKEGANYINTGHVAITDAQGNYRFGTELGLQPGTYQIREAQPAGYFSVGAVPGTVNGATSGQIVAGDRDVLTEITIPLGGQESVHNDFAEAQPATLSGHVYHDRNNNGIREAGEEGIAGVTIVVTPVSSISPQSPLTVTTDANGFYQVTGLAPGVYNVVETQPVNWLDGQDRAGTVNGTPRGVTLNDRIDTITLQGGESGINYDFGELLPVEIHGRVVYTDPDGNCPDVFLPSDQVRPVVGAVIKLYNSQGNLVAETVTNNLGEYHFVALPPGAYKVVEVTPAGLIDSGDHVGYINGTKVGNRTENDTIANIDLQSGQKGEHYDFCESEPASISGYVYHDRNNNGLRQGGEEGISGVTIRLVAYHTPVNPLNGAPSVEILGTTTTNAQGYYQFLGLPKLVSGVNGNDNVVYTIEEVHPAGWRDGLDAAGTVNGVVVGATHNDYLNQLALKFGEHGVEYNFGEIKPASISGYVHLTNADGDCWEPGDTDPAKLPLQGVVIQLLDMQGNLLDQTVTDANGFYDFVDLDPGTYQIREFTPTGLIDGADHIGTINNIKVGAKGVNDLLTEINLASGNDGINYNFCEHLPAELCGFVFHDRDNDGNREPGAGEEGIANVEVYLLDASGNRVTLYDELGNAIGNSIFTEDDGSYCFENLKAGVYTVVEVHPQGWLDGLDSVGTVGGTVNNSNGGDIIRNINLKWGDHGEEYNFGEFKPGSIEGFVHAETDQDCDIEPGELMLAGVEMQLLNTQGTVIATTFTDVNGHYKFDLLPPGTYSVRQIQPTGYFTQGQDPGHEVGSAVLYGDDTVSNLVSSIGLKSSVQLVDVNFCEVPPAKISGYVFIDGPDIALPQGGVLTPNDVPNHRDGQLTSDDRRLGGVTLELRDGITGVPVDASKALPGFYGPGPIRVTTDANGYYEFGGLKAGNYAVYEVQPGPNLIDGIDTPGSQAGIAFNAGTPVNPLVVSTLASNPRNDAIVRIALPPGAHAQQNNFSEVKVDTPFFFDDPPPPPPPPPPLPPPVVNTPPLNAPLIPQYVNPPQFHTGSSGPAYTWHLSVVNSGLPRDLRSPPTDDQLALAGTTLQTIVFGNNALQETSWVLARQDDGGVEKVGEPIFGLDGAIPVSGDFNGDGQAEVGIYYKGEWFVDLNGNGRWDDQDLWARLGDEKDNPVVGDWDGDGKDDIGIYGPAWPGDPKAIEADPGLPDPDNKMHLAGKQKNLPPRKEDAAIGKRHMRLTSTGKVRADLIDHVFEFGQPGDVPVVGDWNGDGIDSIAVFRSGRWSIDVDGDGRWTNLDKTLRGGQAGDIPVVGDWNNDGVDDIGVYRSGKWHLDTDGDGHLTAADKVFDLGTEGDKPTVGDWDGDGRDDIGILRAGKAAAPKVQS